MNALLAYEVRNRGVIDEEFIGRNETARDARHQALREYACERRRELDTDLILLVCRECVDNAVQSLRSVVRMKGREDEVAGLGCSNGSCHGVAIAHLADK